MAMVYNMCENQAEFDRFCQIGYTVVTLLEIKVKQNQLKLMKYVTKCN